MPFLISLPLPLQLSTTPPARDYNFLPRQPHHSKTTSSADSSSHRADEKTASEYNLEGGATLHLVLALRGGL
jgi:hypothetical protein